MGCGRALVSVVAHRYGADVTASDCQPPTAGFLKADLELKGLSPTKYRSGNWGNLVARVARNGHSLLRAVVGEYDVIIGRDVLYKRDEGALLSGFIARHASANAEVWIVDPDRATRATFNRQMAALGCGVTESRMDQSAVGAGLPSKGRLPIQIRSGLK